jgi:hypothetical protein
MSYTEVRLNAEGNERRDGGSLLIKPLAGLVEEKDLVETGLMTTLLVVVPIKAEPIFLGHYETIERASRERREEKEASNAVAKKQPVSSIPTEVTLLTLLTLSTLPTIPTIPTLLFILTPLILRSLLTLLTLPTLTGGSYGRCEGGE